MNIERQWPRWIATGVARLSGSTSVRGRLARATGLMLAGTGLQQLFAMAASIVVARILGKAAFGELGLIRSTTLLFAILAGGGLGLAATRYVAELRMSDPVRTGRVIRFLLLLAWSLGLAGSIVCAVLSRPLASRLIHAEQLTLPLAISSAAIVLSAVSAVQTGVISGCEAFRKFAVLTAVEGLTSGILIVFGAWADGVTGAITGYVVGLLVIYLLRRNLMLAECARASIPLRVSGALSEWPLLTAFIIPSLVVAIGAQPAEWIARVLLARGPGGLAEMGLFTAAFSWAQIVLFIPTQVAVPAMPILTTVLASGDIRAFRRSVLESAVVVLAVGGMAALLIAIASPWIMRLYGDAFRGGAIVLATIVFAQSIGAICVVFRASLLASGRAWFQAALIVGWGTVLIASFFLMGHERALTLAASYGIAFAALAITQFIVVWRAVRGPGTSNDAVEAGAIYLRGDN